MFFLEPISSVVDIDLGFIKVFLELVRVSTKLRGGGGYDFNKSLNRNVIVNSYLDVSVIVFRFFN